MPDSLRDQRIKNMIDATNFREPEKVPVGANFYGWPFHYSGAKYTDLMNDPEKAAQVYVKFFDDCAIDFHYGLGMTMPVRALESLGCYSFAYGEDGNHVMNPQVNDVYCGTWIYDDIIDNAEKFYHDTYLKIRLPGLNAPRDVAYKKLLAALNEHKKLYIFQNAIAKYVKEENQMANFRGCPMSCTAPLTNIFCGVRGIRNMLIDLKRMPDKVHAAGDASWDVFCGPALNAQKGILEKPERASDFPWITGSYHPESFVSTTEFEEIFFKYFKKSVLPYLKKGMKFYLMGEGSFLNTIDLYRQAPKGSVIIQVDTDDPFDLHKKIGDWVSIVCGLKPGMLAVASKQECIDGVKRLFDTFAPGGGFLFMPHHPIMCGVDAKVENIMAMYETANTLSRK